MKKIVALLIALVMCMSAVSVLAEDAVQAMIQVRTTQAFTADAVAEADLSLILQAGLAATSAINQQPWFFAVVTDQNVMAQLNGSTGAAPAGMTPPAADDAASSGAPAGIPDDGASSGASSGAPADGGSSGMPAGGMPTSTSAAKAGLGDSPVAIVIYMNPATASPDPNFDCGLACQNMVVAANALGYGTKIISAPTMTLNGAQHDALCELLGVDKAYTAVAVLLIGKADVAAASSASVRSTVEEKVSVK